MKLGKRNQWNKLSGSPKKRNDNINSNIELSELEIATRKQRAFHLALQYNYQLNGTIRKNRQEAKKRRVQRMLERDEMDKSKPILTIPFLPNLQMFSTNSVIQNCAQQIKK